MAQGIRLSLQGDAIQLVCDALQACNDYKIQSIRAYMLEQLHKSLRGLPRNHAPNKLDQLKMLEALGELPRSQTPTSKQPVNLKDEYAEELLNQIRAELDVDLEQCYVLMDWLTEKHGPDHKDIALVNAYIFGRM